LIVCAGILVCAYALSVLAFVQSIPDIGLRCGFSPEIQHVDPGFFPPGQPVPEVGDRLVQLGEDPVENWPEMLRCLRKLPDKPAQREFDTPPSPDSLKVTEAAHLLVQGQHWVRVQFQTERGEALVTTWCTLGQPPLEILIPSLLWFCLKASLFLVGAFVFWQRPEDRSALQFFVLCGVTCNAYMGGFHWQRIATSPILFLVFLACSVLLPALSLHFYLLFPRAKELLNQRPRSVLVGVYALPICFLALFAWDYLQVRSLFRAEPPDLVGLQQRLAIVLNQVYVYFAVAAFWYLACIVCLLQSYRHAVTVIERNQVKCILVGAVAALVPIGYTLYLAFLEREHFGSGKATWPMFLASLCLTVAFAISITRYRLMQVDQLISSGATYFLISTLAGLVYYGLVFVCMLVVGRQVITGPSLTQALWVSGTALVLVLLLDLIRGRLKKALDHHFRREKYQLDRTLRRMSQVIERLVDPPTLARRLLQTSSELLSVTQGAVYLRDGHPSLYRLADHLGPAPELTELSWGCPLIEALPGQGILMSRPRTSSPLEPAQRQLQYLGGELALPLLHEGQLLALLILGPKTMGPFSEDECNLLTAFAQMTALALISAEGHRTIDSLNRDLQTKVAKIAEQQRRIANLQSQLMRKGVPKKEVQEAKQAEKELASPGPDLETPRLIGSSPPARNLMQLVRKVAASPETVLLRGESGTGKEVLAQALHDASPRAGQAFVKVHCAALSPGLLESELFGHVKGAFTGAHRDKIGRFEMAHGGTLFLDEIGDINLEVQTKLLRVLQEKTIERVGSSQPLPVDVRLIAATNQNLEELIRQKRFREDLYYRLNVVSIALPPLRERREDIVELASHFLRTYAQRVVKEVTQIDDDALAILKGHPWPGNIRQLENVIARAVVLAEGPTITIQELPTELFSPDVEVQEETVGSATSSSPFGRPHGRRTERERQEREQLVRALAAASGNKAEAARSLGISRSTFFSRLRKHGLS
jgi:transcriptional regulator with GAF, ATPase, and Fis domain